MTTVKFFEAKQTTLQSLSVRLIELYASVQGETSLTGFPTLFIRFAACNLRCRWCDSVFSFGRGTSFSFEDILKSVDESGCRHVCITGGEPLLQDNVYPLMTLLADKGYIVSLETSGSLPIEKVDPRVISIVDIKCPGSEMAEKNCWKNLQFLRPHDEVKFVIADREDYEFAKRVCLEHNLFSKIRSILFSPVFNELDPKELISWILQDKLPVRLNLQIHKYIWAPEARGV